MIIVAGHLIVDPATREAVLDARTEVVAAARSAPGCLDFHLCADALEPDRINVFERWETVEAVEAFRASGPDDPQDDIRGGNVAQYDTASEISLMESAAE